MRFVFAHDPAPTVVRIQCNRGTGSLPRAIRGTRAVRTVERFQVVVVTTQLARCAEAYRGHRRQGAACCGIDRLRPPPKADMTACEAIGSKTSAAESVDTACCRTSRTRSNRRLEGGVARHNPCTRRKTGRHRSAWFRWPGGRNADRSTCSAEPVESSWGFYDEPGERHSRKRELVPAYIRSCFF